MIRSLNWRKRVLIFLAGCALLVIVTVLLLSALWLSETPGSRISKGNQANIKQGMTLADVQELLGNSGTHCSSKGLVKIWGWREDRQAVIFVSFDEEGKVINSTFGDIRDDVLSKILRQLGLR